MDHFPFRSHEKKWLQSWVEDRIETSFAARLAAKHCEVSTNHKKLDFLNSSRVSQLTKIGSLRQEFESIEISFTMERSFALQMKSMAKQQIQLFHKLGLLSEGFNLRQSYKHAKSRLESILSEVAASRIATNHMGKSPAKTHA